MDIVIETFLVELAELAERPGVAFIEGVRSAVLRLASDSEYWARKIDDVPLQHLHWPDFGPRLAVVHRTHGRMSAIHSHGVWVALVPLRGVETHRTYRAAPGFATPTARFAEERRLVAGSGEMVTLLPPHDIHSHGHRRGSGPWPHTLVVLGDDHLRRDRWEFDAATGRGTPIPAGIPESSGTERAVPRRRYATET